MAISATVTACAARAPEPRPPGASAPAPAREAAAPGAVTAVGETEVGVASWYGEPFHGRRTASGEVYDMDRLSAAHQTLPFGTLLRVENRDNGRTVELRVTDRGPFAKDRILDVSRAGARALGMIGPGTANVRITVLEVGGDLVAIRGGCVVVQVAAYRDRRVARDRADALAERGHRAEVEDGGGWFRVVVGPFEDPDRAAETRDALAGFVRRCG